MNPTVVSLGGGCDVALILREFGVRQESHPLDWLWNLDTGLETVSDILADGFSKILNRDSYALSSHYRFPDKLSVTFRDYPSVVHLHSDPLRNPDDYRTMLRRIDRLQRTLQDAPHLTFLYYRIFEEGRIRRIDTTLQAEFKRLEREGARFSELISERRAGKESRLVLVFQTAPDHRRVAADLIRAANNHQGGRCQVSYAYTFTRNDDSVAEMRAWKSQWRHVLSRNCGLSSAPLLYRRLKTSSRRLAASLANRGT